MNILSALGHLQLWVPLLGIVLPLLVAFVTRESTHSGIQGVLFTLAAGILGVVTQGIYASQHHTAFMWSTALVAAVGAWVVGQVGHISLFKPLGWSHAVQKVGPISDAKAPPTGVIAARLSKVVSGPEASPTATKMEALDNKDAT